MGDVHLARPRDPNRGVPTPVVVKRLHGELADKQAFVSRFKHEAAIAVSVDSAHVAKVFDAGAVGGTLYLAMEYVPGWPLSIVLEEVFRSGRHAPIEAVLDCLRGGLLGLRALHSAIDVETGQALGIVHRDISPKNLMVGEDGLTRIIDLGIGKSNRQGWKTQPGVLMGTVGYMPPEQAAGEHVDGRADLYAMGVVGFEMLVLRNFIKRGPLLEMMAASLEPRFRLPSTLRPDVPRAVDLLFERALRPDRGGRFQTADEFLRALEEAMPPSQTDGSLAALVEHLFEGTRAAREREMEELLALANRADDPVEAEPTRVFVQRKGILPLASDATWASAEVPTLPPTVATQVAWKEGPSSTAFPHPSVTPEITPPSESNEQTEPQGVAHAVLPNPGGPRSKHIGAKGVPMSVLLASVVAASMAGALFAVIVIEVWGPRPAAPVVTAPVPSPPRVDPRAERPVEAKRAEIVPGPEAPRTVTSGAEGRGEAGDSQLRSSGRVRHGREIPDRQSDSGDGVRLRSVAVRSDAPPGRTRARASSVDPAELGEKRLSREGLQAELASLLERIDFVLEKKLEDERKEEIRRLRIAVARDLNALGEQVETAPIRERWMRLEMDFRRLAPRGDSVE